MHPIHPCARPAAGVFLLAAAVLGGCAALPGPDGALQPAAKVALATLPSPAAAVDAWPAEDWWKAYGDPQLDRLIAQALAGHPNLALARARIAQAQAAAGVARGGAAPQVTADASAGYGRQSEHYLMPRPPLGKGGEYVSQGQAIINLGYDLDLWGRNAALIAAAEDQARAAAFDYAGARLALAVSIARAYAQLASQHELLDITDATLKQREATADLIRKRLAAGLDTRLEVRQAETGSASLAAERVQLEAALAVTRLQLAALAGAMPEAASAIARPRLTTPAFNLPASLPLDLLGRRPEIAAQGSRIAAAREGIAVARAEFYPNINLAALIGVQAIGLNHLFSAGSMTSNVGPAFHLPLFEGGRLRAAYQQRTAELEGAVAQYDQSVLAAAQEVVEQLTRGAALDREAVSADAALAAAQEAHRIALLRYREGLTSYLSVLAVEGQLLTQQRAIADLKARRLDAHIALVRALGGGFSAMPPATDHPSQEQKP
ncbi:MAG TPA: efflux transporter outer membrane subunit [Rhodocyclaceae bacterium]|nr:efflux transporter outer membrane subunit [Rhodocyclaceae bacterium]